MIGFVGTIFGALFPFWRWIMIIVLAAGGGYAWHVYDRHKAVNAAVDQVHDDYAVLAAIEDGKQRAIEHQRAGLAQKERHAALQREKVARGAADAARSELDGLRAALAAGGAGGATAAPGPGADGARTGELLLECSEAHLGLSAQADRLAGKVTGLQRYITDQCLSAGAPEPD